jgi:hypothetical protein
LRELKNLRAKIDCLEPVLWVLVFGVLDDLILCIKQRKAERKTRLQGLVNGPCDGRTLVFEFVEEARAQELGRGLEAFSETSSQGTDAIYGGADTAHV